jgi:hypothetical protein
MTAPIEHPPWCQIEGCGVCRTPVGTPVGTHVSRRIMIGDKNAADTIAIELAIRQLEGWPPQIGFNVYRNRRRVVEASCDLDEAQRMARTIADMVQQAQRP